MSFSKTHESEEMREAFDFPQDTHILVTHVCSRLLEKKMPSLDFPLLLPDSRLPLAPLLGLLPALLPPFLPPALPPMPFAYSSTSIISCQIPPLLISDLAWVEVPPSEITIQKKVPCCQCGDSHPRFYHWGSRQLLDKVLEKKPKVHQFGHVHDSPKTLLYQGTLFVNAANDLLPVIRCFDCII
jgi:hypothetical protein